ncbi:MAG: lysophospholipid acyltransferase family protein [Desulfobacterales bacterium]|jgi:1-acyl-sn-glycerol-3-phosphate acyltransferase
MRPGQKPSKKKGAVAENPSPLRHNKRLPQHLPGRKENLCRIIRFVARMLLLPFFRLKVKGTQNLPRDSAFILLVKHQRWEDIPLVSIAAPRPLYYIAKYELFQNNLNNWFISVMGGIPLNRQRPLESRRFLRAAIALLKAGEGMVIFPEGTYFRDRMGPGQIGIVKFVLSRLTLPFIPVGINYSGGRRIRVRINFGKAYHAGPTLAADSLVKRMMAEIAELSGLSGH